MIGLVEAALRFRKARGEKLLRVRITEARVDLLVAEELVAREHRVLRLNGGFDRQMPELHLQGLGVAV